MSIAGVNNLIVVSDPHCGCKHGLCPAKGVTLDDGGRYKPGRLQKRVWNRCWVPFWRDWVPEATRGEPFAVLVNGDMIDGTHHNSVTQISNNLADQAHVATTIFEDIVNKCADTGDPAHPKHFYMIRGTEAHVGASGQEEERLARILGAVPDEDGRHARYELWIKVGKAMIHALHHIGTTGSAQYESSALMSELAAEYAEAGRNRNTPPDVVVRSHRHRNIEVRVPSHLGYGIVFTTPGWQLKTPFVYRLPGGRVTSPQIGGSIIRQGDEDLYTRHRVWHIGRPKVVRL